MKVNFASYLKSIEIEVVNSIKCTVARLLGAFYALLAIKSYLDQDCAHRTCSLCKGKGRLSLYMSLGAYHAGAYPGFRSVKRLGVLLLPPGWDASPSQGYSQQ